MVGFLENGRQNATRVVMVGEFSDWQEREEFVLRPGTHGEWSVDLPASALHHGQKYKLQIGRAHV